MPKSLILGGLLAAAIAVPAVADPVKITANVLTEVREPAKDGTVRVSLQPAKRVVPGDHVVYRLTVANGSAKPAAGIVVASPVPDNLQYAGPAAGVPAPELSIDGKTFGPLSSLTVPAAAGGTRPATNADVRVVRWKLVQPVAAGGEGAVAFRALLK